MSKTRVHLLLQLDSITNELKDGLLLTVVKFAESALEKQQGKQQQRSQSTADRRPYQSFKAGEIDE